MRLSLAADGIGLLATLGSRKGFSARIGFTSKKVHPIAKIKLATLANIHHLGLGAVPQRKILVTVPGVDRSQVLKPFTSAAADMMRKR